MNKPMRAMGTAGLAATLALVLASCVSFVPQPEGIGRPVEWTDLPGWYSDHHAQAWPALQQSCRRLAAEDPAWHAVCESAKVLGEPDDDTARMFFEAQFVPHEIIAGDGETQGLITGYYEPLLNASLKPSRRFRYPLYRRPADLLTVDLGALYPELQGRPVRGRLEGDRVVPYYSRSEISNGRHPLRGHELAWVDDPIDLFFLHIQGSGRLRLPDGRELAVGYADQNGHPYEAIGARLIAMNAIAREDISLQTIKQWLVENPGRAEWLLNSNPSYIFFETRPAELDGPLGSLNVPLTAERSIAVDRRYYPLGVPVWLDTRLPDEEQTPYQRLVFAQDTGGAIKGAARADVFFGNGARAEQLAGRMKQPGTLFVLLPRAPAPSQYASGVVSQ